MARRTNHRMWLIKPFLFVLCLLPMAGLILQAWTDALGANPIEAIIHATGDWTLRLLLVTLACTPLRRFTGWGWPVRVRRMFGLFAFAYALSHLLAYTWLDQFFDWQAIFEDVLDRPFITIGMLAFTLLLPLAVTSTNSMMRRLGRNWKRLHRLAYLIPALGVIHFWWLVKADLLEPLMYAMFLAALMLLRLPYTRRAGTKLRH